MERLLFKLLSNFCLKRLTILMNMIKAWVMILFKFLLQTGKLDLVHRILWSNNFSFIQHFYDMCNKSLFEILFSIFLHNYGEPEFQNTKSEEDFNIIQQFSLCTLFCWEINESSRKLENWRDMKKTWGKTKNILMNCEISREKSNQRIESIILEIIIKN